MKSFIVLFAVVAVVSAGHLALHSGPQHIHVGGQPNIPAPHAAPLALLGNDHTTRIHYSGPHVGHPHLVGIEAYHPAPHFEPSVSQVAVGHGGGHGGWH